MDYMRFIETYMEPHVLLGISILDFHLKLKMGKSVTCIRVRSMITLAVYIYYMYSYILNIPIFLGMCSPRFD